MHLTFYPESKVVLPNAPHSRSLFWSRHELWSGTEPLSSSQCTGHSEAAENLLLPLAVQFYLINGEYIGKCIILQTRERKVFFFFFNQHFLTVINYSQPNFFGKVFVFFFFNIIVELPLQLQAVFWNPALLSL